MQITNCIIQNRFPKILFMILFLNLYRSSNRAFFFHIFFDHMSLVHVTAKSAAARKIPRPPAAEKPSTQPRQSIKQAAKVQV